MQTQLQLNCSARMAFRTSMAQRATRMARSSSRIGVQSGSREEPFNEGAVQVRRLVDRDRREMLGNKVDILDKFETEFGDPDEPAAAAASPAATAAATAAAAAAASSSGASTAAAPASPFAPSAGAAGSSSSSKRATAVAAKFGAGGAAGPASPFGAGGGVAPMRPRNTMEPAGLTPDMSPDPIVKAAPTPGNLLSKITLTQVVLFCTFTSMIALMLGTFSVVINSGAVRLAGIE